MNHSFLYHKDKQVTAGSHDSGTTEICTKITGIKFPHNHVIAEFLKIFTYFAFQSHLSRLAFIFSFLFDTACRIPAINPMGPSFFGNILPNLELAATASYETHVTLISSVEICDSIYLDPLSSFWLANDLQ
jgi:hypothetical protein